MDRIGVYCCWAPDVVYIAMFTCVPCIYLPNDVPFLYTLLVDINVVHLSLCMFVCLAHLWRPQNHFLDTTLIRPSSIGGYSMFIDLIDKHSYIYR